MTFHVGPLLPLFALGVHVALSQVSFATCEGDEYVWSFNSKSQSPCDMAAYLMTACQGSNYSVDPFTPDDPYVGPLGGEDKPCTCSTVTWSLFAACATCQNGSPISWSQWSTNCSSPLVSSFPNNIPPETAIPDWAYLGPGEDGMWNVTAAKLDSDRPESTATPPPLSTSPGPPETTNLGPPEATNASDEGGKNGSRSMIGPIAGGVVGGVAVLTILVVGILVARRRYIASQRPPSTLHGPQGISPYRPVPVPHSPISPSYSREPSMAQKSYDLSDPGIYPSPLSYEPSTTTHTSMPDSSVYGQQPYQAHVAPLTPNRYTNPQ